MTTPNRPAPPRAWTPQQLGDFVDHVRNDQFFALWMLVATTGIRLDSLVDLRRDDVDLQEARLSPRPTAATGSGRVPLSVARSYALDPHTREALREHVIAWDKDREGQRSDRIFVWSDNEPLRPKSVEVLFRRHCHNAGLPVVPLQAARAAYVVAAIETGIPTAVIGERLGRAVTPMTIGQIPSVDVRPPAPPRKSTPSVETAPRRASDPDRRRSCHLRSC